MMNQVALASTGRSTSQLGCGGSGLMGATSRRASLALLEHAFDAGIRHFDVAPMYGYGAAEGCLGEFLARHPGQLTITTKYGILPPPNPGLLRVARRAVGPVIRLLPGIRQRLARATQTVATAAPKAPFTAEAARRALDRSLKELCTEHIDVWLLHEAEAHDLEEDRLVGFLQDAVSSGRIGTFGCGSSAEKIPALLTHKPEYCPVLQFQWSVLDPPVSLSSRRAPPAASGSEASPPFTLHHRSLTARFGDLRTVLRQNADLCRRWSEQVGADLAQPGTLAALMLKAALVLNPRSVILVSSRNPAHITANVRVACDETLSDAAAKLYRLAQSEGASVLSQG